MRLRTSRDTPFVVSPSSIEASRRSFKLDLPFCSDRLLNLPLIPRLSRFFSSFFHPFVFFVSPLRWVPSTLLLLLPPLLYLVLLSLLSPPFCIPISPCFAAFHRPLLAGERYAPTGFELSRISFRCEIKPRSSFLRPRFFRSNISDIDMCRQKQSRLCVATSHSQVFN